MKQSFDYCKKQHDGASLEQFNNDSVGQLWLKLKSIIRPELIKEFINMNNIILSESTTSKQFEELFAILSKDIAVSHRLLDIYIQNKNKLILKELDTNKLVSELYKLKTFEWGGDYKNSLDKYLVSHYVKTIKSYDELMSKFDTEIVRAVQGYILNSWYNHW